MPNYAVPNISNVPNPALSSMPIAINNALVANPANSYLLQRNNVTMNSGFSSTPQTMQAGLVQNNQQPAVTQPVSFNVNK